MPALTVFAIGPLMPVLMPVSGVWRWSSAGWVEGDLAGVGVVVEQFGVAAPIDGGVELLLGVVGREAAAEQVQEEPSAEGAAGTGGEG